MSNARSLALVIALLVAAGGGFLAGSLHQPSEAQPTANLDIAAIESKLDRLLDELRTHTPPREPLREPVGTAAAQPELSRLAALVSEMSERLAALPAVSQVSPVARPLPTVNSNAVAALYATLPDEKHAAQGLDPSSPAFGRTISSLLASFGAPQRVNQSDSQLTLEYELDADRAIRVQCSQGIVVAAYATQPLLKRERERLERQIASAAESLRTLPDGDVRDRLTEAKASNERELARLLKSGQR